MFHLKKFVFLRIPYPKHFILIINFGKEPGFHPKRWFLGFGTLFDPMRCSHKQEVGQSASLINQQLPSRVLVAIAAFQGFQFTIRASHQRPTEGIQCFRSTPPHQATAVGRKHPGGTARVTQKEKTLSKQGVST